MSLPEAYEYASKIMVENLLAIDGKEGIGVFIEKRAYSWKDKYIKMTNPFNKDLDQNPAN